MSQEEMIELILSEKFELIDKKALKLSLDDQVFVEDLVQQLQVDESLSQHLDPRREMDLFSANLMSRPEFCFTDTADFVAGVMAKIPEQGSSAKNPKDRLESDDREAPPTASQKVELAFMRRRMSRRTVAGIAAAAMLAFSFSYWIFAPKKVARVDSSMVEYRLKRGSMWSYKTGPIDLHEGDLLETEEELLIIDSDGKTLITLGADSQLEMMTSNREGLGAHYRLLLGNLRAEIAPQPKDSPMGFSTRHGRVVVLGTIIRLQAEKNFSRVEVERGLVRWENNMTGETALVNAGESQEIRYVTVRSSVEDPNPKLQWNTQSDMGYNIQGPCQVPAQDKNHRVTAECVLALEKPSKLFSQAQAHPVYYQLVNGEQVLKGRLSSQEELNVPAGTWQVKIWSDCLAGEVFDPGIKVEVGK